MIMYNFTLNECVAALQNFTTRKLRVMGTERACILLDENAVDVLRSGFVSQDELKHLMIAAVSFVEMCRDSTVVSNISPEEHEDTEEVADEPKENGAAKPKWFLFRMIWR